VFLGNNLKLKTSDQGRSFGGSPEVLLWSFFWEREVLEERKPVLSKKMGFLSS